MLANDNPIKAVKKVNKVPPKYNHLPRSAVSEATEKQTKIAAVDMRAVTIILGLIVMA